VTGLVGIVVGFAGKRIVEIGREKGTEVRAMRIAKNILVGSPTENVQNGISSLQLFKWRQKATLNPKQRGLSLLREYSGNTTNDVDFVARPSRQRFMLRSAFFGPSRIDRPKRLILSEGKDEDSISVIQRWSFSSILQNHSNRNVVVRKFGMFDSFRSHPGTLVNSEIPVRIQNALMGIFGYFLIGAPDRNSSNGVDTQNKKTKPFQSQGPPIYPIALCVNGYLALLCGWRWRVRPNHRWWIGVFIMVLGFGASVSGGLLWIDRVFGVF